MEREGGLPRIAMGAEEEPSDPKAKKDEESGQSELWLDLVPGVALPGHVPCRAAPKTAAGFCNSARRAEKLGKLRGPLTGLGDLAVGTRRER